MKIFKFLFIAVCFLLSTAISVGQCSSGCTTVVSASTNTDYTVSGGQQLCITSTGIINGNITLDGGTICNQGFIQSQFITINNGNFNNYGVVKYAGILELKNTSIFTNYSSGILKLGNKMFIHPNASYLAGNGAQLLVLNPAPPLAAFVAPALRTLVPDVDWVRNYGGSSGESPRGIIATKDGGCVFTASTTSSASGDVTDVNHGGFDMWMVKLDVAGNIVWNKNIGNPSWDIPYGWGIYEDDDGGIIASCEVNCAADPGIRDFDVNVANAPNDVGIVKVDANGNILWTRAVGGVGSDLPVTVKRTADEGLMVCGQTNSNGGDIIGGNTGEVDAFAIKMNAARAIQWVKIIGTTGYDFFSDFVELSNGDFVFAGAKETPTNDEDFLAVKVDGTNGNTIWEKTYGGTGEDNANNIEPVEGGFILSGYTYSKDGLVGGDGSGNVWTIKIDMNGDILWRSLFGGSGQENCNGLVATVDGGSVNSGFSTSNDNGITTINDVQGIRDNLLFKYTAAGELEWSKITGTAPNERAFQVSQTRDGGFVIASEFSSANGTDIAPGHGTGDVLITKFKEPAYAAFTGSAVTFTNKTTNGSTYQWKVNNVNVATTANLTHTFSTAGTYTVSLTAYNGEYAHIKNSKVVVSAGELVVDTRGLDTLILPDTLKYTISGAGLSGTYTVGSLQTFHPTIPSGSSVSTISLLFETESNQSVILDVDLTAAGITQNARIRPPVGETEQPPCASINSGCFEVGNVIKINDCFLRNCFRLNNTVYAVLKRELDNGFFNTTNGAFRFKFSEEYNDTDSKLSLRVYDDLHKLLYNSGSVLPAAQFNSSYGTYYYSIDLNNCDAGVRYSGFYTIEVENEKKEVWKVRIKNERTGPIKWFDPCAVGPIQIPIDGIGD